MNNKYVVIDLETTGNSPKRGDRIIQFAAVVIENGKIVDTFSSLVNPRARIPLFIEELTGIHNDMVMEAPYFEELAPKIQNLLEDAYFVAHNVLFDLSFLQEELIMAGQEGFYGTVIDTVELARFLFPTFDSFKLNDLANSLGFQHDRPHQADSDAEVTALLLMHFIEKMEDIPLSTCKQLSELSGGLKSDIQLLFEELIDKKSMKKENLSSELESVNGIFLRRKKTSSEQVANDQLGISYPRLETEKEKLLKQAFETYQNRYGQFQMMDSVFDSFIKRQHLVVEAGTGIGKSLGYLLPAIYFAKETGNKLLISTFTIQLQSQLILKDIPLLKGILPFEFKIALLKGKNHYISLSKFADSLNETEDNYDTCLTKMQILVWLLETDTGDVDELNLTSGGQIYWNRIKHGYRTNMTNEQWLQHDFYLHSKRMINEANLVITNHSFLLADIANQNTLNNIDYIVLDEAHHFHKVAVKYYGAQLDYFKVRLVLNQIGLLEQKQLLFKLENMLSSSHETSNLFITLNKLISDLFFEMDEFFKSVRIYVKTLSKSETNHKVSLKINRNACDFDMILHSAERFTFLLKEFLDLIQLLCSGLTEQKLKKYEQKLLDEMIQASKDLIDMREYIQRIFLKPRDEDVAWIEIDFRSYQNSTTIYLQPVSVSEKLRDEFFNKKKSVILTSATLTIDNQFYYILKELGLSQSQMQTVSIPSPFDYESKVKVFIPKDLPEIKKVSIDDYIVAISEQIISIAEATKGRMLILFTSHEMLRKTYSLMKESGLLEEYALIAQGITSGSHARLTRNFQKFDKAILFGTNSFWEGIDIPGEDLSCLIIVRLPFTPPEEPYMQARAEHLKRMGGDPFTELSLPEAVLRFKQGFGRLIRTEDDKGVMIIFDRRIVTSNYGMAFLKSIPALPIKEKKTEEILSILRSWLT